MVMVTGIAHGYTALANLYAVPFTTQAQKALEDCFDTDVFYRLRFWLVQMGGAT